MSGTGVTILDCYDSQVHSGSVGVEIGGATNTDSTHYRCVRSSPSCTTPFAGKVSTGATFSNTNSNFGMFDVDESWSRIQDLSATCSINTTLSRSLFSSSGISHYNVFLNCIAYNGANIGSGTVNGFNLSITTDARWNLAYNCIAYGNKTNGFTCNVYTSSTRIAAFLGCTSIANGAEGFSSASTAGGPFVWSCYAANNTTADYDANWDSVSGWCASKDNTASLGGVAGDNYKHGLDLITGGQLDANYLATTSISGSGGAGDNYGRNPYDDFSSVISDFSDFLKNDAAWQPEAILSIEGNTRPDYDTADVQWCVGASQYVSSAGGYGNTINGVLAGSLAKFNGVARASIAKVNGV